MWILEFFIKVSESGVFVKSMVSGLRQCNFHTLSNAVKSWGKQYHIYTLSKVANISFSFLITDLFCTMLY